MRQNIKLNFQHQKNRKNAFSLVWRRISHYFGPQPTFPSPKLPLTQNTQQEEENEKNKIQQNYQKFNFSYLSKKLP